MYAIKLTEVGVYIMQQVEIVVMCAEICVSTDLRVTERLLLYLKFYLFLIKNANNK